MTEKQKTGGNSGNSGNTALNSLKTSTEFVPTFQIRGGNRWEPVENYLGGRWEQWEHFEKVGTRQRTENNALTSSVPTFPTVPTCLDKRGYEGGKDRKTCKRRILTRLGTHAKRASISIHSTQRKQPRASVTGTRRQRISRTMENRSLTTRWLQKKTAAASTDHRVNGQEKPGEYRSAEARATDSTWTEQRQRRCMSRPRLERWKCVWRRPSAGN